VQRIENAPDEGARGRLIAGLFFSFGCRDNDPMSNRSCGECTACCEGWLSSDVTGMSPYRPCQHCTARGCAIYENRPQDPCVKFVCGWLQPGSPMPEHLRPDRAGVIVMFDRKWHDWKTITAIATGEAIPEPTLEWLKAHAQNTRTPLLLTEYILEDGRFAGARNRGFGPPAFAEEVRLSIGPEDIFRL
jgi:hypothetical protein